MKKPPILPRREGRPFEFVEFEGVPGVHLPGNLWYSMSKHFSITGEEARRLLLDMRKRFLWSRPQMASFLGVPRDTLRRWETGDRNATGAALRLIWLVWTLTTHPEKVRNGLDLVFWGRGEELRKIGQAVGFGAGVLGAHASTGE